jgi:hypothetical protein
MTTPKIKTFLRNAKVKLSETGKVESITGQCSERGCKNLRTIAPQDAFQVRRCERCQRAHLQEKRNAKRKAKAQARRAKAEAKKQRTAKREAKLMSSPAAKQIATAMAKALEG